MLQFCETMCIAITTSRNVSKENILGDILIYFQFRKQRPKCRISAVFCLVLVSIEKLADSINTKGRKSHFDLINTGEQQSRTPAGLRTRPRPLPRCG
jgi:hypothetical protein